MAERAAVAPAAQGAKDIWKVTAGNGGWPGTYDKVDDMRVGMPYQRQVSEDLLMREEVVGDQAFVSDGGEVFRRGASGRAARSAWLVIYVENAGDFVVSLEAVEAVHAQKVIVNCGKLEQRLREAIGHAHDAEELGA